MIESLTDLSSIPKLTISQPIENLGAWAKPLGDHVKIK